MERPDRRGTAGLGGDTGPTRALAFSKDGQWLATGGDDKAAKIWDVQTGQVLRSITGHEQSVLTVAFSADGEKLATGGAARSARVTYTKTGQTQHTFYGHSGTVVGVAFSPSGTALVSTARDGTSKTWNVVTGAEAWSLTNVVDLAGVILPQASKPPVTSSPPCLGTSPPCVAYSPNGERLIG